MCGTCAIVAKSTHPNPKTLVQMGTKILGIRWRNFGVSYSPESYDSSPGLPQGCYRFNRLWGARLWSRKSGILDSIVSSAEWNREWFPESICQFIWRLSHHTDFGNWYWPVAASYMASSAASMMFNLKFYENSHFFDMGSQTVLIVLVLSTHRHISFSSDRHVGERMIDDRWPSIIMSRDILGSFRSLFGMWKVLILYHTEESLHFEQRGYCDWCSAFSTFSNCISLATCNCSWKR